MKAEVLLVAEERAYSVRHCADAELEAVTVAHKVGNIFADFLIFLSDLRRLGLRQRLPRQQEAIDIRDMYKALAEGTRHIRVDLCDDRLGGLDRLPAVIARKSDGNISALIRRRAGKCKYIYRQFAVAEHVRYIGKEYRGVIRAVFRNRLARRAANKQCIMAEMFFHARL